MFHASASSATKTSFSIFAIGAVRGDETLHCSA
jgi:hypothetical protein